MAFAALICWFATAFVGLYLVAVWLIENDVNQEGNVASRLPGPVILTHVLLALTGFVFWVIHLIFGSPVWGWAALAALGGIALLGATMFTRWIPVHAAFVTAESGPAGMSAEFDYPAERAFPVTVVTIHGVLAVTTLILVLLAMLGVGVH